MLSLRPTESSHPRVLTPNLLPCTIHHNGPLKISKRHWNPQAHASSDGTRTAYFRGRKLKGRSVSVPEGYRGFLTVKTEKKLEPAGEVGRTLESRGAEVEWVDASEEGESEEVKIMEQEAQFEELIVWGHEAVPGDEEDEYVKGIEEWMKFAEAIHGDEMSDSKGSNGISSKEAA